MRSLASFLATLLITASFCSGAAEELGRFAVSADGQEVRDQKLGLIWRRCAEGTALAGRECVGAPRSFTHDKAKEYAAMAHEQSGVFWRIPSGKELASLAVDRGTAPAIDPQLFPDTPPAVFWSSSPHEGFGFYGGGVPVSYSQVPYLNREKFRYLLRLVRSAP